LVKILGHFPTNQNGTAFTVPQVGTVLTKGVRSHPSLVPVQVRSSSN